MGPGSFTHADRTRRNLRWATIASVPCALFLIYLIAAQGITEAWVSGFHAIPREFRAVSGPSYFNRYHLVSSWLGCTKRGAD